LFTSRYGNPGFEELAQKHFAFLVRDYGFTLAPTPPIRTVVYEKPQCTVSIAQEFALVMLSISPPQSSNPIAYTKSYWIEHIVNFKCGNEDYKNEKIGANYSLDAKLSELATSLQRYADDLLRGDWSCEPALDQWMREHSRWGWLW
jgi:hypothetical protein